MGKIDLPLAILANQGGLGKDLSPLAERVRGMRVDQIKHLKELEQGNTWLKKRASDLSLDNDILIGQL